MHTVETISPPIRTFRFDPVDLDLLRLKFSIPPEKRLQAMLSKRSTIIMNGMIAYFKAIRQYLFYKYEWLLNRREILVSAIRSRLRHRYPDLTDRELNLKLFEEIDRARALESGVKDAQT